MAIEFGSRKETFENFKVYETMLAGRPFKVEMGKMCGTVGGELVAVALGAHDAHECKPRGCLAAVIDDIRNFRIQAALHQSKGHTFQ